MSISVKAVWSGGSRVLRGPIDTRSATQLVVREGAIPITDLSKYVWQVTFLTASGQVLPGGSQGLKLQLNLSVQDDLRVSDDHELNHGTGYTTVACVPIWAYSAKLHQTDLIIGYPFLDGFGLAVDPTAGCRRFTSDSEVLRRLEAGS